MLDFQRLDVYQAALDLLAEALVVADGIPVGYRGIADQLKRASVSIPLNIAEAMGRGGRDDRRRFVTIARGSAMETGALFDVIDRLSQTGQRPSPHARDLVTRVVSMLTRLGAGSSSW